MKKCFIHTWGCQMNIHDSEKILGLLKREGYTPVNDPKGADIIVFNTCSIRQKAEQKFYSQLGKMKSLKRGNPDLKVVVAGCLAQQMGKELKEKVPHVDFVIGPQNIDRVGEALAHNEGLYTEDNYELPVINLPAERDSSMKAWVNIMYGCNNFCSYCVVPFTRGREVSRPVNNILSEVRGLSSAGYKEITLLGQNVNSYRGDVNFPELLRLLNNIKGIERIRFVTSHPKDLGNELIKAIRELEKVCEHIHLPLQSGSDRILRLMNRKYTFEEFLRKIDLLREAIPEIAITTDIIAGFPTEEEDDHKATMRALEKIKFDGIFAFKFSSRPMTKAAKMDGQLTDTVKAGRLSEILRLQDGITEVKNKALKDTLQKVLVEGISENNPNLFIGRTMTNKIVIFPKADYIIPGMLLYIKILKANRHSLEGLVIGN